MASARDFDFINTGTQRPNGGGGDSRELPRNGDTNSNRARSGDAS